MERRIKFAVLILGGAPLLVSGCARHIVRADSPSVVTAPIPEPRPVASASAPQPEPTPPPEIPQPEPELSPPLAAEPAPPRPRPAPAASAPAPPPPSAPVAAPRISPVLSAAEQERLTQLATNQIRVAERNIQSANGKRLNSAQQDLYQKVQGFLAQAHEAIRANDWVRAQNLAEKAQVLSSELIKSL
jgi:hypothetical protein